MVRIHHLRSTGRAYAMAAFELKCPAYFLSNTSRRRRSAACVRDTSLGYPQPVTARGPEAHRMVRGSTVIAGRIAAQRYRKGQGNHPFMRER